MFCTAISVTKIRKAFEENLTNRRACIKKAFGIAKSWHSNYQKWLTDKEKHEAKQAKKLEVATLQGKKYFVKKFTKKPPVPPRDDV